MIPYEVIYDVPQWQFQSLFNWFTDPSTGGGGYMLRSFTTYGSSINPSYTAIFVRSPPRPQRLILSVASSGLEALQVAQRAEGFFPKHISSPGVSGPWQDFSFVNFDILFERSLPGTAIDRLLFLDEIGDYVTEVKSNLLRRMNGEKGTIWSIAAFPFGDTPAFIAIVTDGTLSPTRLEAFNLIRGVSVGTGSEAWMVDPSNVAMYQGWARPQSLVALNQGSQASPPLLLTDFLTLWRGDVFVPWDNPLDPATFHGGTAVYAPLRMQELKALLSNPPENPPWWPYEISAMDVVGTTLFSLIVSAPGVLDPLPRKLRSLSGSAGVQTKEAVPHWKVVFDESYSARGHAELASPRQLEVNSSELGIRWDDLVEDLPSEPEAFVLGNVVSPGSPSLGAFPEEASQRQGKGWTTQHVSGTDQSVISNHTAPELDFIPGLEFHGNSNNPVILNEQSPPHLITTIFGGLDQYILSIFRTLGARMMQISICRNEKLVYTRSFTYAEDGYPPPSLQARLPYASCNKPLVTCALLRAMGVHATSEPEVINAVLKTRFIDVMKISPIRNLAGFNVLTLEQLMCHRSNIRPDLHSRIPAVLAPLEGVAPKDYIVKPGDCTRYMMLTHDTDVFTPGPPPGDAHYLDVGFDILGEVLSYVVTKDFGQFAAAFRSVLSSASKFYLPDDLHFQQRSWAQLVAQGDFHRQARTPVTMNDHIDKTVILPDFLGTGWEGFDAGSGSMIMSSAELARILSRLNVWASAEPLLTHPERQTLAVDPFMGLPGSQGALTFGGFPRGSPRGGDRWFDLWHNGDYIGGSADITHRTVTTGFNGTTYSISIAYNMDGSMDVIDPITILDLIQKLDQRGLLPNIDLFDVLP